MKKTLLAAAGIVCLLISSCALSSSPGPSGGTTPDGSGSISLSISPLAASRAVGRADTVVLTVFRADGTTEQTQTVSAGTGTIKQVLTVPAADGYTIRAAIFNTAVSSETAVVTGTSEAFTVTAQKTTAVTVSCTPTAPEELTADTESPAAAIGLSAEKWYSFTALSSGTTVSVTQTVKKQIVYAVYNGAGIKSVKFDDANPDLATNAEKTNTSSSVSTLNVRTIQGGTYYVVIIATGGENTVQTTITDNPQKTVSFTSLSDGAAVTTPQFTPAGTWSAKESPETITVTFAGLQSSASINSDGSWSASFDASSCADGQKSCTVKACWASGTERSSSIRIQYTGSPDVAGYTISGTVTKTEDCPLTTGTLLLTLSNGCIPVDSYFKEITEEETVKTYPYSFTGISAGTYQLTLYAVDTAADTTFSREETITITKDCDYTIELAAPDGSVSVSIS